jgi:hypothetical protein
VEPTIHQLMLRLSNGYVPLKVRVLVARVVAHWLSCLSFLAAIMCRASTSLRWGLARLAVSPAGSCACARGASALDVDGFFCACRLYWFLAFIILLEFVQDCRCHHKPKRHGINGIQNVCNHFGWRYFFKIHLFQCFVEQGFNFFGFLELHIICRMLCERICVLGFDLVYQAF